MRDNHPNWKGGKYKSARGYVHILKPDHHFCDIRGYIVEHHIVWEEYHKASLLSWGVVHHINHIRHDNRIENLEAMMKVEHDRLESYLRQRNNGSFT